MTSDVYAADDGLTGSSAKPPSGTTEFVVIGDAQPDFLLRVGYQLLLCNELPTRVEMVRQMESATIEIEFTGIADGVAESIFRKIAQLSCVHSIRRRGTHNDL